MTLMPVSNASHLHVLLDEGRRRAVDGQLRLSAFTGPRSSTGSPMTFRMRPSISAPTGHRDGRAGVLDRHAAHQAVGRVHGDAADGVLAEVLRDLDDEVVRARRRWRGS